MARHELAGRLDTIERRLSPAGDWQVWLPVDDERDDLVRNRATHEMMARAEVDRLPGHHVVIEYVKEVPFTSSAPAGQPTIITDHGRASG